MMEEITLNTLVKRTILSKHKTITEFINANKDKNINQGNLSTMLKNTDKSTITTAKAIELLDMVGANLFLITEVGNFKLK